MSVAHRPNTLPLDAATTVRDELCIRWIIPRRTLGASTTGARLLAALDRAGAAGEETSLLWRISPDGAASASLVAGAAAEPLVGPADALLVRRTDDPESGLEHIDVTRGSAKLLTASIRRSPGNRAAAIYAVTPLLAHIGIPGGRYSAPDATLRPVEGCPTPRAFLTA